MGLGTVSGTGHSVLLDLKLTGVKKLQNDLKKVSRGFLALNKTGLGEKQIAGIGRTKKMFADLNKKSSASIELTQANKQGLQDLFSGVTPQTATFGKVMGMSHEQFSTFNKEGRSFVGRGARMANKLRMMTAGLKGFRMEMLGVMFFGMAMTRMFGGLLKPAAQAMGIFDLWSETLSIIFLPTMLSLFPAIVNVTGALMNLPTSVQQVFGNIALAGIGLGTVLAVGGTLALGLGSTLTAFGEIKTMARLTKNSLKSLGGIMRGLSLAAGLVLTYTWVKDAAEMMTDIQTSWNDRIGSVMKGTMAGALIGFTFGPGGALVGAVIGFGISMTVNLMDIAWERGWDAKLAEWVQGAIQSIKDALSKIQQWWVNLKVNIATRGEGDSWGVSYDENGVGTYNKVNDFLMRPGQAPVAMNPNDTVVGFKGKSPFGSGGATINQTLNITVSNAEEMIRLIRSENDSLVNKLQRNLG